ncbi:alpha-rhamnosidase [Planctomycetota bacterium]|nr:alpha-rhamnosidase [Planctomycetota bacterium]
MIRIMKDYHLLRFLLLRFLFCAMLATRLASVEISSLRCDDLDDPLGVDEAAPSLSWRLAGTERGLRQTAWQVQAASSAEALAAGRADRWDSGKIAGEDPLNRPWGGSPLGGGERVHWRVRVWDGAGQATPWSAPAWFETALLTPADWAGAAWIAAPEGIDGAPLLRRTFAVDRAVQSARLYVCGLGYHEVRINGARVGDHELDPACTAYHKRALAEVHDVTALVRSGDNTIGLMLGNGPFNQGVADVWGHHQAPWRRKPCVLVLLVVRHADGSPTTVVSGKEWFAAKGPVVANELRTGTVWDARRELPGWDTPRSTGGDWHPVVTVAAPTARIGFQDMPPIRVIRSLPPVAVRRTGDAWVVDFGANIAGRVRLTAIDAPAGTELALLHAEILGKDGRPDPYELGQHLKQDKARFQIDRYLCRGGGGETFAPPFTSHGFRYIAITGLPGTLLPEQVRAEQLATDLPKTGGFTCSNDVLNWIEETTRWSYLGNYQGIPMDCPQREHNGWTADAHLVAEFGILAQGNRSAYRKWLDDFSDAQSADGNLPSIVPSPGFTWGNGIDWVSAYHLIAWNLYLYGGDRRILERHHQPMAQYLAFAQQKLAKDDLIKSGLGDWGAPPGGGSPAAVTSTAFYFQVASIVGASARILGRTAEADAADNLALRIRSAFTKAFVDPATGKVGNGSQTALACALATGLLDPAVVPLSRTRLIERLAADRGALTTGCLGTRWLPMALGAADRGDLFVQAAARPEPPSYAWMRADGATTLYEFWKLSPGVSRNHVFLGSPTVWFRQGLCGLTADPSGPGLAKVVIRPQPTAGLNHAEAWTEHPRGRFAWGWKREGDRLRVTITIPPTASAVVHLPANQPAAITEDGKPLAGRPEFAIASASDGRVTVSVGSGTYQFDVPEPKL